MPSDGLLGQPDDGEAAVVHVQSGGSTGAPKALCRPLQTWVTSALLEAQAFGLSAHDRFAILGGEHHSLWGYVHFRAGQVEAPCLGLSAAEMAFLSPQALGQWNEMAPTVLYGVPELVAAFARQLQRKGQPALSVRMLLLGGGPVLPSFPFETVASVFPNARCFCFYGTAQTSFVGHRPLDAAAVATYELFPSVELDIRAMNPEEAMGELWVRSPMTITPQAWVNTGDLGQWAANGGFHVLGRAARQLVVKGEKYVVEPLEEALMQRFGLAPVALLMDAQGRVSCIAAGHGSLDVQQINAVLRAYRSHSPSVRRLVALAAEDWPLTAAGKTDFPALQARLDEAGA